MRTLMVLLLAVTFSFAQWGGERPIDQFDYKKVSVSGRDVYVHAPKGLADNSPLLLSLHGMDQDPTYQHNHTMWENVADTAGFLVVYPNGGKGYSTWDISGDQDTKWITQIIDQMVKDYKVDPKRVYLSGFSMGGMFSYHAMGKIADKIAAFAPCSGYLMGGAGTAMRPVPIFHTHGTSDDVVGYSGLENNLGSYRKQFNCPSQAEVIENYPNSENKGTLYTWGPCDGGVYVKHLKLEGRQHSPSSADVSDIWNFVKQYSLDGVAAAIEVPTDRDTVFNGSFSDSLKIAGWALTQHAGSGSVKFKDGEMEISVSETGTNAYDIQVIQKGMHYEKGQSYKLTFDAYASAPRSLEVNLEKDTEPWTSYSTAKTFDLGTEKKNYEIRFTMSEATDTDGRISINAGLDKGSVYIDNVVISKIEASDVNVGGNETPADSGNVAPADTGKLFIANQRLLLTTEKTYSVYNLKGSLVCKLAGFRVTDVQAQMKSMKLDKGLYVIKNGNFSKTVSVK